MLFDPITGELRFEAATNMDPTLQGIVIPVEGSIAGWIVTHAEPLVVSDTRNDPRWNKTVDKVTEFVTRSIVGVPLETRNKTLGALEVLNKREGLFTAEDISTLQALSAQASVAIVNARLFQQSDMISEMVHELRTPLMSLGATTHLLLRPDLPEDKRAFLIKTMQGETQRLSQMTTDFLDMARLESGRMRFSKEPFDVPELLVECADVIRPQAQGRGITLTVNTPMAQQTVASDRGKIKQVILNLLTNAVKYNREHGQITLGLEVSEATCRVSVTDTGKGIPPDAMAHMFEKFYRVPDTEGKTSGTGLGLPIARKMVEALGGEMGVESTVGVGSVFYFALPVG
jgi:signal transduction histidine kinase